MLALGICQNRSNTCGCTSRPIPLPVSATETHATPSVSATDTDTRPFGGVNLIALPRRFDSTCPMRGASAITVSAGPLLTSNATPALETSGRRVVSARSNRSDRVMGCMSTRSSPASALVTSSKS